MSTEAHSGSTEPSSEKAAHDAQNAAPPKTEEASASAFASASAATRAAFEEVSAAADAGGPTAKHHDDLIADLRREMSDYRDKNLRLLAEMENLRRRTDEEKASSARYAIQRFATDIVTVGDNFQRAMSAVPAGAADTDPALKSLVEGVQMIEREYLNVLERHGVKRIAAKGEIFSPHLHQPMMQVPDATVPAGTIMQVFQDGYTIGDRLLRAAVVTVAEGGPKPGKPAPAATEAGPDAPEAGSGSAPEGEPPAGQP